MEVRETAGDNRNLLQSLSAPFSLLIGDVFGASLRCAAAAV